MMARAHAAAVGQCLPACTTGMDPGRIPREMADLNSVVVRLLPNVHREAFGRDVDVTIEIRRSANAAGVRAGSRRSHASRSADAAAPRGAQSLNLSDPIGIR